MSRIRFTILLLFLSYQMNVCFAQTETEFVAKSYFLNKATSEIKIDGVLDDEAWNNVPLADKFYIQDPTDGELADKVTEVKMVYSELGIYVAAKCFDDDYFIETLKRDELGDSDEFSVIIDPFNQKSNGYGFGVNAMGAQTEVLINVGRDDTSWDNRWFVSTKIEDGFWTAEFYIPFKTLRFKSDNNIWGFNFIRTDPGQNEKHVWSPVPRQFSERDLGYLGQVTWDKTPQVTSKNISFIPYVNGKTERIVDPTSDPEVSTIADFGIGGDAKIALNTGLNLDLTVNPDFSQVEVDQQVTNLTRFNVFFPERRQFFIENADIFTEFGQGANQPFYSRRIGLDASGGTVPIIGGARLTGNISPKTRIGILNMHTKSTDSFLAQNYSAATFEHRIGQRSNIKGIFLNRQAFDGTTAESGDYGRNLGLEGNWIRPDGKYAAKLGAIQSFKADSDGPDRHLYGRFDYDGQNFRSFIYFQNVGRDYSTDMGFNARLNNFNPITNEIVRIGYTEISGMLNYFLYPKNSERVNFHWSGIENFVFVNENTGLNEWYTRFRHFIFYKNTSELRFRLNYQFQELVFPFAITETPIPAGQYDIWEFNIQFNTDTRKDFSIKSFTVYGEFFDGNKLTYMLDLFYRLQPWGNFSIGIEQNFIRLPEPYGDVDVNLFSGRAEINFSTSLFWTTFVQYNSQSKNFNINSRFQWRFAPMSDLFLVYTDDYLIEDNFGPRDRSLVLKASYWLSL